MIIRTILIASSLLFAGNLAAATVKGDAANGKKVFEASKDTKGQPVAACTSCHGVGNTGKLPDGSAAPGENPIVAGQYSDYLSKALHDYKNKKRAHIGMQGNAGRLSDKEIADVSVYLGSLKSKVHDLSEHED
ncbi:MAG: c-type cytochrome [Arenimonas sp.]